MSAGLRFVSVTLTLGLTLGGCVEETEPEGDLVVLDDGKADTTEPAIEFDEADPRWEEVVECVGWDLCLSILVAANDRSEPDSTFYYPMHLALDEVFFADNVQISPNCDGRIAFDPDKNIYCVPEDGEPFVFGAAESLDNASDSPWQWVSFDYETPARARLFRDTESEGAGIFYLDIR